VLFAEDLLFKLQRVSVDWFSLVVLAVKGQALRSSRLRLGYLERGSQASERRLGMESHASADYLTFLGERKEVRNGISCQCRLLHIPRGNVRNGISY